MDLFQKMRKSLGNKRNELSQENIDEVVRLYGEFKESERSKIFENDDFGYRRIVVERPLRLNFRTSPERVERVKEATAFQNLARSKKKGKLAEQEVAAGKAMQERILAALATLDAGRLWKDREQFEEALDAALAPVTRVAAPVRAAVLSALSERDDTADICFDSDGNPEPDAELRDYENVPRKDDIQTYLAREVKPHVPDAQVDESKTKDGYEIPFTHYFYKYSPLRPLVDIEADIRQMEAEIQGMLGEVLR